MIKINIKKIISLSLLSFFAVGLFGAGKLEPNTNNNKKEKEKSEVSVELNELNTFVIIENEGPHVLDPHLTSHSDDSQILTGLYEGLFSYNPSTLEPVPGISSGYKVARDKKRWTFTINPKAKFSDGTQITAEDVRRTWIKLLSTKNAPYSSLLDVIEGAKEFRTGTGKEEDVGIYATSKDVLLIHLCKPANYLPKLFCHPAFAIISDKPNVFSGPYVIAEQKDKTLVLKKNRNYWDKDKVEIEQITFIQSNNGDENTYYYNTGMVDWISGTANYTKLINQKSFVYNALFGTSYLFFKIGDRHVGDNKIWENKKFRQALLEAVPWDGIRKDLYFPAETFVYPLQGYPVIEGFSYTDKIEAGKLIDAAKKETGLSAEAKISISLEIPEFGLSDNDIKLLKDSWGELGVEVSVLKIPGAVYYESIGSSKSDMFSYSWIGDFADPLAFLELFRSDSSLNDSGWKNAEFDRLLDEAASCSDSERYKLLGQAESILLDDYMIIPINHNMSMNVINLEGISGWSPNAFDIHPLKYLKKKKIPSKVPNII